MYFNSIDFAVFLPVVFLLYWFVWQKNLQKQNLFIVLVSYIFYGWWDSRFLVLLVVSSMIDFFASQAIFRTTDVRKRRLWFILSIASNLGILGFFKYFNFFADNFASAFTFMGFEFTQRTLEIVLPVGISFYTFQTMSYTIDVYRRKLEPTHDVIAFMAYVSFFPQLVAGPIERAKHLLPQFYTPRTFNYQLAVNGTKQILWGFFKKMVIADNCAILADTFFNNHNAYPGSYLLLGAFFFAFQIYGDFSGYSDIAIGTARLFGFDIMKNFAYPYFSRDIAEFWRRWHISLSTWFRDYVYIPMGGNQGTTPAKLKNIIVVFVISGFWHGANWTFVCWGLLNALLFIPLLLNKSNRQHLDVVAKAKIWPTFMEAMQMCFTFMLVMLLWVFFRADSMHTAFCIIGKIFSSSIFQFPYLPKEGTVALTLLLITFFIAVEWSGREHAYAIEYAAKDRPVWIRWTFYALIVSMTGMYMQTGGSPFIYFQF
ncbi:MAG: MBOAT family protein [Saprospiraceae bacterium]|nr:MBOAT family protein [Saprospiraceae bacterium]